MSREKAKSGNWSRDPRYSWDALPIPLLFHQRVRASMLDEGGLEERGGCVSGSWRGIPRRYHGTHAAGRRYLGETRGFLIIATANDALPLVLAHVFPPLESFFRPKVENR